MKQYAIPAAIVIGAVVVWYLLNQVDKAKQNKPDVVDEVLQSNAGITVGEMDIQLGNLALPDTAELLIQG